MTGRFDLTSWCFKRLIKMLANSTLKFVTHMRQTWIDFSSL